MRSCEDERPCQEAQVHYYDLLCQEEAAVPPVVRRHVATCPVCQERMRRLRESLFEAQRPAGAWQDETVEALAQQFQLLDERVTCSEARPRLPELALESPQIRIPTPVTVHVDHCSQCGADLAAIRELHLSADQLKRLGRLLATRRGVRLGGAESVGTADATGSLRPAVPASLSSQDAGIACPDIVAADLFDRVVPSDSAPPGGRTARERQRAVARHVQSCPACLGRVRTLQRTIGEIVARADSDVVTVYHADNDADEAQSEYPYPVSVQVLHGAAEAAGEARDVRAALATGLRRLERSAKPVAALVLIGVALTLLLRTTTPTASGTSLGDVDKTGARMKNIHVVVTGDLDAEPTQEYWIARQSSIVVSKTGQHCVLYDLAHDRRRTLDLQSGVRTSERLSLDDGGAQRARQFMAGYLMCEVAEVAPDTKLDRAAGEIDSGTGRALDVYELPLPPDVKDSLSRRRWLYVDPVEGLPRKMVASRQRLGENRRDSVTTTSFTYLTGPAMAQEIERLFPPQ